jgi:hypothetical protein
LVPVARQCPFPFRTGFDDISGQTRCCGEKPPTQFSRSRTSGFFSLSYSENCPQRKGFQDIENIKKNVTSELNAVPLESFADCFQKLFERCNKCIHVGGDYFE